MRKNNQAGFTLVELTVGLVVIMMMALGLYSMFNSLIKSMILARRQSVALTLATGQLEYLRSLPYDSLAVAGGAIYSPSPLPATKVSTVNGVKYTIVTSINYADDAYDGCGSYPNLQTKQKYCRNYPPPASAPATDLNPADYKTVNVHAKDIGGTRLATVDTQITARVSESASTTGALFVTVVDGSGAPISGGTVSITNSTVSPSVNLGDSTDSNGVAIFYNLPPDAGNDYVVTASKSSHSSVSTIAASGSLQPNYQNQKILSQQSSSITLVIAPMTPNSLVVETTNTTGTPLAGVKVYAKGGYKKYTLGTNSEYYFDNLNGADTRPTTDGIGLASISNLAPVNSYLFCGDRGDTGCVLGGTTYYMAAAVPYAGAESLQPISIPPYPVSNPPAASYTYNGNNFVQKVRLMLTTSSSFPRVFTIAPDQINLSSTSNINAFDLTITGVNISTASMRLTQGSQTFSGTGCTGNTAPTAPNYDQRTCTFDLTAAVVGQLQLSVTNGAGTLTLPTTPLGGFTIAP